MATTALPSGFFLRAAELADLGVVMHHREQMFRDMGARDEVALAEAMKLSKPFFAQRLVDGSYRAWLVEARRSVAAGGGIVLLHHHASPRDPHDRRPVVVNLYTEPAHRRRGLARYLMQTMIAWALEQGYSSLYLHASTDGQPLYRELGFGETTEMRLPLDRESRNLSVDQIRWQRWQEWVRRIKDDLSGTVNDQADFRAFMETVRPNSSWINEHQGGWFCNFVVRCYVARTALGIRRQLKDDDSFSLVRLLRQIRDGAHHVTYEFFTQQFPSEPECSVPWQEAAFRALSDDGIALSAKVVERDIGDLRDLSGSLESFCDRTLAHLDRKGFDGKLTLRDLEEAVSAFNRVVCKYYNFLTGSGYDSLEAAALYNPTEIFRHPLAHPK